MPLERSKGLEHHSFWSMLMILIYWGKNINTINKNNETLLDARKEVGLEVNEEATKYMLTSHHQNQGQNHNIKKANKFFKNVATFKHVKMTVTVLHT
jgi:predicted esterase YcpF (UPF0227 family)